MSGGLTGALKTAQSGLMTNQVALNAVSNNISNVNSPGYSRKIVNTQQKVVNGVGVGVEISDLTRNVDEGLLKSMRLEFSKLEKLGVKNDYMSRMQDLFGSPSDNNSISSITTELVNSIETLAASPEKSLEQNDVIRWSKELTLKFREMSKTISELRLQADSDIADQVSELNSLISSIGNYNDLIIRNASVKRDVSDLKDQRDQALNKMSKIIDIRYYFRADGDAVVFTSNGRTLVDNVPNSVTHNKTSSVSASSTHANGDFSGIFVGPAVSSNDITNEITGGKLKGLIELRDENLTNLQSQLDEMASEIRDAVNKIHNRGIAFPGMQSMSGTRNLASSATQRIRLNGTSDTRIVIFDNSGNQKASVSLTALMEDANFGGNTSTSGYTGGSGGGNGAYTNNDFWIVDEMANVIQRWVNDNPLTGAGSITGAGLGITGATVSVSDGKLNININNVSYNMAFRDENVENVPGSTQTDATVEFDSNGDGSADETVSGFSNFFGLNDLFVDGQLDKTYESDVLDSTFTASTSVIAFTDSTKKITIGGTFQVGDTYTATVNGTVYSYTSALPDASNTDAAAGLAALIDANSSVTATSSGAVISIVSSDGSSYSLTSVGASDGGGTNDQTATVSQGAMTGSSLTVPLGTTLTGLVSLINSSITGVKASLVPDGSGFRLRIVSDDGGNFSISQDSGTLLTDIGMHRSNVGVASSIDVRSDIKTTPSKISRGTVQWDATRGAAGEYYASTGDDTSIKAMATMLATSNSFDTAGGIGSISLTFSEYSSSILSTNASLVDTNKTSFDFQQSLSNSLKEKSDTVRGVNLDEEMSSLILFEQAYTASARIVSIIQKMFDALERTI